MQTALFCILVAVLVCFLGILVRKSTNDSNSSSGDNIGLALTNWINGPPPDHTNNGYPIWTTDQILTLADALDFIVSGSTISGIFSVRLGLRLVYSSGVSNSIQDQIFNYTFMVRF